MAWRRFLVFIGFCYRFACHQTQCGTHRRRAMEESRSQSYQHHEVGHPVFPPASQPAHAPVVKPGAQLYRRAKPQEFRFHLCVVPRLLYPNLGRRLLGPSLPHHQWWRRGRQILNLHVDRESFASDLANDRRGSGFIWRSRKRQHVVLGVLHNHSHASPSPPLASLHNSAESPLLSLLCHP